VGLRLKNVGTIPGSNPKVVGIDQVGLVGLRRVGDREEVAVAVVVIDQIKSVGLRQLDFLLSLNHFTLDLTRSGRWDCNLVKPEVTASQKWSSWS